MKYDCLNIYLYYYIIIVLFYIQLQVPNTPKKMVGNRQ